MQQTQFNYQIPNPPRKTFIEICKSYNPDFKYAKLRLDCDHPDFNKLPVKLKQRLQRNEKKPFKWRKSDPLLFMNKDMRLIGWIKYNALLKELKE